MNSSENISNKGVHIVLFYSTASNRFNHTNLLNAFNQYSNIVRKIQVDGNFEMQQKIRSKFGITSDKLPCLMIKAINNQRPVLFYGLEVLEYAKSMRYKMVHDLESMGFQQLINLKQQVQQQPQQPQQPQQNQVQQMRYNSQVQQQGQQQQQPVKPKVNPNVPQNAIKKKRNLSSGSLKIKMAQANNNAKDLPSESEMIGFLKSDEQYNVRKMKDVKEGSATVSKQVDEMEMTKYLQQMKSVVNDSYNKNDMEGQQNRRSSGIRQRATDGEVQQYANSFAQRNGGDMYNKESIQKYANNR